MIPVKRLVLLFIFLSILFGRLGLAQSPELAPVPDAVREALLDGDYDRARGELNALRRSRPEHADLWAFLEGRAYEMEGNAARAAGSYNALASSHPDSPWRHKADYRRADLLRGLGAIEEAEAVWAAAVERLRAADRQDELAAVYLDAADELVATDAAPDRSGPDWTRAFDLYGRALELSLSDGPRDRALRGRLRCVRERADWSGVVAATQAWIDAFGGLNEAGLPPRGSEGIAMVIDRAAAEVRGSQHGAARRRLEDLLRDVTAAIEADGAIPEGWPEDRAEATYWLARAWGDEVERAEPVYRHYLDGTPAPRSLEVLQRIAEAWNAHGRSESALAAYDELLAAESRAEDDEARARDRERQIAALYSKGILQIGMERPDDALATLRQYTTRYPSGAHWIPAQRAIEQALIQQMDLLAQRDREAEERAAIEDFLAERPLDDRAPRLRLRAARTWLHEARRLRDDDRPREAWEPLMRAGLADLERVVVKHPDTDVASEALYEIGTVFEVELVEPRAALDAYRRCTFGSYAYASRERRRAMTETQLEVITERAWRTDESPRLTIHARNLEELELRVYELNLETYFRKHATHEDVEGLDLDLIAPDRRIELPVPDYAPYAALEFEAALPFEGPGVWAVTVVGDELSATTLVIKSDIDVIAKLSHDEAFVFAQDVLRDAPAPGVRILCAVPREDGTTLLEATTDETGVARFALEVDEVYEEASLLALRGDHVASCGSSVGAAVAGLSGAHRVFLHTDRHVYRQGDRVRWRAVARKLIDGRDRYTVGDPYRVRVTDPGGRVVWEEDLALGEYGSIHDEFALPANAQRGSYEVTCSADGVALSSASFRVEQFQLQRISLELTTPEAVYYRGETVELEVSAGFYYGSPLADAPLTLHLPDGTVAELVTDEDGLATYRYDTADHLRSRTLRFSARLRDEGVTTGTAVHLATQGMQLSVSADRDALTVGDELLATIRCTAPDGTPLSRPLTVEWLRRSEGDRGETFETREQVAQVSTDEDGLVRASFRPESGGEYVVRALGEDRFGNAVSGAATVEVSGSDDPRRLRFFAARRAFTVGDAADLELVDRTDGGLTLITLETDGVQSYRITRLQPGKNLVRVDLEDVHAPNLLVAAARASRSGLLEDSIELDVQRELIVRIEAGEAPVAPGGEAEVTIVTTDRAGRPVRAEVSLAVVDEALYDLFPHVAPRIREAFELPRRPYADEPVQTISSCDFEYYADTETIAAALIAEAVRREEEARWRDRRRQAVGALSELASGAPVDSSADDFFLGATVVEEAEEEFNDAIGIGGGAGGSYGGRFGGKRVLRAAGGKGSELPSAEADWLDSITAYWNAGVVTDVEGRAVVRFRIPERSTAWRLTSHGAGLDGSFGDADGRLVSRSPWFVELAAPLALTEGDQPTIVARVHNVDRLSGELELRFAVDDAEPTVERVVLNGEPLVDVQLGRLAAVVAPSVTLDVTATGTLGDAATQSRDRRELVVRPWGLDVQATRSGVLDGTRSVELQLPEHSHRAGRTLTVRVGRGMEAALLDALTDRYPMRCGLEYAPPTVAGDAWTLIGVLELMERSATSVDSAPNEFSALRARARVLVAQLLAARLTRGGWPETYGSEVNHDQSAAAAAIALGRARRAGIAMSATTLTKVRKAALDRYRELNASQGEEKALFLHALASLGEPTEDFSSRLFRDRARAGVTALAHLALALAADGRQPMAAEVAGVLEGLVDDEGRLLDAQSIELVGNSVERRALALLALSAAKPDSPAADRLADGLLADMPWGTARTRGLAVAALAGRSNRPAPRAETRVTLRCAGQEPRVVTLDASTPVAQVRFALGDADPDEIRLDLDPEGNGDAQFIALLSGTAPVVEQLGNDPARIAAVRYVAAAPIYRGRELPVGFRTVGESPSDRDRNPRRECELGGRVDLQVRLRSMTWTSAGAHVFEVPLPAGVRVDARSLDALGFAHAVHPDRLVVFLPEGRKSATFDLTLLGLHPGEYRALPATLRPLDRPREVITGDVVNLRVLSRGVATEEPYDPSPDEQYALGSRAFEAGDRDLARVQLEALYRRWSDRLEPDPLRETSRMLLDLAIERGDQRAVVEHFEVLGEKSPDLVVEYEDLLAVAAAYRAIGEHENALRIERALVVETFGKDLRVAGALDELGDFVASTRTMRRLWLEYPDVPMVVETALTLSDRLLEEAPRAHLDADLRAAGRDRAALTLEGILELQRFLAVYADDPQASDAALNLLSALFELEDYVRAEAFAGRMAAAAQRPRYVDAFLYSQAIARWELGDDEGAKQLLLRISQAKYEDEHGRERASENRELALYLLGQIHHARQEFADASVYYRAVAELFSDAAQALAGFRERRIEMDEVTRSRPGEPVAIELRHRNLAEVELLVYPVDLMTLYLRERSLSDVAGVELSGIAPLVSRVVALEHDVDLRDRTTRVELGLEEAGAYLVMARAGEEFTSGLALVSDLALEVDADADSGRVRVQVLNDASGAFERDVDVRVIGVGNEEFVAGRSDQRGLFVADGILGEGTVIARAGERRYAFLRGVEGLAYEDEDAQRSDANKPSSGVFYEEPVLLDKVIDFNAGNRQQRKSNFDRELQRERTGLEVRKVQQ